MKHHPGPQATAIILPRLIRAQLDKVCAAATSQQRDVLRAGIILAASRNESNQQIARTLGVQANTVRKWRGRFARSGREGLRDLPRPGPQPRIDCQTRCLILAMACDVPKDYAIEERERWTVASLQQAALEAEYAQAISRSTVWRILNQAELRPHHHRMWLHSPDPDFASKVSEVTGLYLNPPAGSVVLSIDEKTAMQAVERKHPGRLPGLGFCGRREFEYRRHGTQTLLAALHVHTGQVFGQCRDRRTAQDLLDFMNQVAQLYPKRPLHVVWDNLNIHRGVRWEDFNRKHGGRFHFHFTPLHASWVNQIECWFSILARRVLRYGTFASTQQLAERVLGFISHWNQYEARPFRWTFKGYPLQMGLAA